MQLPIKLSWAEANALLDRAVQERGADFVYKRPDDPFMAKCLYFHGPKQPGCIVGQILAYKGLENLDEALNVVGIDGLHQKGILDVDTRTGELLSVVQSNQDDGIPWGAAVDGGRTFVDENDYGEGEGD